MNAVLFALAWSLVGCIVCLVLVRCFDYLNEPDVDTISFGDEACHDDFDPVERSLDS